MTDSIETIIKARLRETNECVGMLQERGQLQDAYQARCNTHSWLESILLDSNGGDYVGIEARNTAGTKWASIHKDLYSPLIMYWDETGLTDISRYMSSPRALSCLVDDGYLVPDKGAFDRMM